MAILNECSILAMALVERTASRRMQNTLLSLHRILYDGGRGSLLVLLGLNSISFDRASVETVGAHACVQQLRNFYIIQLRFRSDYVTR